MSLEDEIAAGAISAVWANPMMRLTAISQAAANLAIVAEAAHNIATLVALRSDAPEQKEFCIRAFLVRNACLDNIEELLKQIKNEPTP